MIFLRALFRNTKAAVKSLCQGNMRDVNIQDILPTNKEAIQDRKV